MVCELRDRAVTLPALVALAAALAAEPGRAQSATAPRDATAPIFSMGQPSRLHPYAGAYASWIARGEDQGGGAGLVGAFYDITPPVSGAFAVGLEGYLGGGSDGADVGLRGLAVLPAAYTQIGLDWDPRRKRSNLIVGLNVPIRRGGLVGHASQLRVDWIPSRDQTFNFGLTIPFGDRWIKTPRFRETEAPLPRAPSRATRPATNGHAANDARVDSALATAADAATWITHYTMAFQDQEESNDEAKSLRRFRERMEAWHDSIAQRSERYPTGHDYASVVAVYHGEVERAFAYAIGAPAYAAGGSSYAGGPADTTVARRVADAARAALLGEVLLPYDRLIGRLKDPDRLDGLGARATESFARWLVDSSGVPPERQAAAVAVLGRLTRIADAERARIVAEWDGDSRPAWLPLQLALRPDQHDTQAELDALIARAVAEPFTGGNEVVAITSAWFQRGLLATIHAARQYHVLWLHDYRGRNAAQTPDVVGFAQTVRGYLAALTQRVREYDSTGTLPAYIILLDQHFYEANDGRLWMTLLEDPLHHEVDLGRYRAMAAQLRRAQRELRLAVDSSRRLQADAAAHPRGWIERVVKVNVNITNRPNWSARSSDIVLGLPLLPDHLQRDHRKIAFFDVSERDPGRGAVVYTGTGVGERYATELWDDRAVAVAGPAALSAKRAARHALLQQGLTLEEIPPPLRDAPLPPDYDAMVAAREAAGADVSVLSVHNEVGFAQKNATLVQAMLYTLMPGGCVIYVPDSIWLGPLWAGQLVGAAFRGCKVHVITPGLTNSPVASPMVMSRTRDVMARMLIMQQVLGGEFAKLGGSFHVGLYTRQAAIGDLDALLRESANGLRRYPFLREVLPFSDGIARNLDVAADSLRASGVRPTPLLSEITDGEPMLHRKTQFFATREAIEAMSRDPQSVGLVGDQIRAIGRLLPGRDSVSALIQSSRTISKSFEQAHERLPQAVRERAVYYWTTGSMNKDPNSAWLNGEVMTVVSGPQSLSSFLDFFTVAGTTTWLTSQEELDTLIPPYGSLTRWLGRVFRQVL